MLRFKAVLYYVDESLRINLLRSFWHDIFIQRFATFCCTLIIRFSLIPYVLFCDNKLMRVIDGLALMLTKKDPLKQTSYAIQSNDVLDIELSQEALVSQQHLLVLLLVTLDVTRSGKAASEAAAKFWQEMEQSIGQVVTAEASPDLDL